jgi:hypothetical protein
MSSRRRELPDALLLDEMFSPAIATSLVDRGIDCQAIAARPSLRALGDSDVLEAALSEARVLVTNNVVDFEILRRRREAEGRATPGFIYTSDDRFPRNRAFVSRLADALEDVARRHTVRTHGGVLWLTPVEQMPLDSEQ